MRYKIKNHSKNLETYPFMQAGTYRLTLRAKDEDTVRIRLDFIQFTVKVHNDNFLLKK